MSGSIICPKCNSQDIQKIEKNITTTTEKSGCGRIIAGVLFFPLLFLMGKKTKTKTQVYTYYACRACGQEFRSEA